MSNKPQDNMNNACFYANLLPTLRKRARELGYALAVHGSMTNDLDVMAMPWVQEAVSAEELAKALAEACCSHVYVYKDEPDKDWRLTSNETKPYGRLAWTIYCGGHPHVDLSVMPKPKLGGGTT